MRFVLIFIISISNAYSCDGVSPGQMAKDFLCSLPFIGKHFGNFPANIEELKRDNPTNFAVMAGVKSIINTAGTPLDTVVTRLQTKKRISFNPRDLYHGAGYIFLQQIPKNTGQYSVLSEVPKLFSEDRHPAVKHAATALGLSTFNAAFLTPWDLLKMRRQTSETPEKYRLKYMIKRREVPFLWKGSRAMFYEGMWGWNAFLFGNYYLHELARYFHPENKLSFGAMVGTSITLGAVDVLTCYPWQMWRYQVQQEGGTQHKNASRYFKAKWKHEITKHKGSKLPTFFGMYNGRKAVIAAVIRSGLLVLFDGVTIYITRGH
ncbi:MAG: hypothetical protein ACPGXY_04855 [Alphaproteobacteria bacterium]